MLFLSFATSKHALMQCSGLYMQTINFLMHYNGFIAKCRHLQNVFSCNAMVPETVMKARSLICFITLEAVNTKKTLCSIEAFVA